MTTLASLGNHGYLGEEVSSLVWKQSQELRRKTPIGILWLWPPRESWAVGLSQVVSRSASTASW